MTSDEKAIRQVIEDWAAAVRALEMDAILANHTADMVMFDVPEPLQSLGMAAYKQTWDLFFQYSKGGPTAFNIREMQVTAGDTVAFVTAILTIEGGPLRLTVGLRKESGRWLIAHEHHSYAAKMGE
ncbi:nuclear transport factor 2 family protein [Devosia sediminis]|uniref:Nuclear transport factor 2 family protein n=1 Tax=Devosia sediminis TaxID=2798801 RepID=A0A934MGS6_9HYPH|nr:nuclear transport factor 2 family protein [Devosia sediminis]MBJ3784262.1 nuclear transport factor 2 family protein [Devosia sediminis]